MLLYCFVFRRILIEGEGGKFWVSDFNDFNYIVGRNVMIIGINIFFNDRIIGFNEENFIVIVY